jgi:bifunctional ADP-heptose synthase (sugar kinase/adenylyltransferase)
MRVLIIGESCKDVFVYCSSNRLCPEAPVPVLKPIFTEDNEGMAGNVYNNIIDIAKILQIEDIDVTIISQKESKFTKTRYVDKKTNHLFFRVDEEVHCDTIDIKKYHNHISDADITIICDYNKGLLSLDTIEYIGLHSKLSILDTKRKITDEVVSSHTFVKMNESEWRNNIQLKDTRDIIVTLGDKGALYQGTFYKTQPKDNSDVSGAGDTFTSAFILKYFMTYDIHRSINFANDMAGIVVLKRGVKTPI